MTTANSSSGNLDPAAGEAADTAADLAALLDVEVEAAETGRIPGQPEAAPAARSADGAPSAEAPVPEETIDVPPLAAAAIPSAVVAVEVAPEPIAPAPPPSQPVITLPPPPPAAAAPAASQAITPEEPARLTVPPEAERSLPTTKRFGAIILETEPAASAAAYIEGEDGSMQAAGASVRVLPPGPGTEVEPSPLPVVIDRTPDQKAIVIERLDQVLDQGWQKALHQQIDELYRQVATEFSSPPDKAERALTMLRESRQLLIDSPEEYVTAEFRTAQVRVMLDRMRESRKQSTYYGPRILGYQAGWLLVLLLGLIFAGPLTTLIAGSDRVTGPALLNVYPIINTMIWGGIGGIVGALYTLWWHISREQDFDRNYLMWYMVQPLMGLVLGGIIFLIMAGGFLIINVNLTDETASTGARLLPYLAAVLAGFRQNFIYEQFDRLIALFTPAEKRESGNE